MEELPGSPSDGANDGQKTQHSQDIDAQHRHAPGLHPLRRPTAKHGLTEGLVNLRNPGSNRRPELGPHGIRLQLVVEASRQGRLLETIQATFSLLSFVEVLDAVQKLRRLHHLRWPHDAFLIDSLLQEPCQFHRKLRQLIVGGQFQHGCPIRHRKVELVSTFEGRLACFGVEHVSATGSLACHHSVPQEFFRSLGQEEGGPLSPSLLFGALQAPRDRRIVPTAFNAESIASTENHILGHVVA
mmetsp:Transcript_25701/g.56246  ORF Transcript_25701/g.56246 Transcript_25701/m.56246 type:complete len:242 (+) Transcript_25701:13-738(+)